MSDARCLSLPELTQQLLQADARLPIGVTADLTYRCNLRCAHCFCRLPENAPQAARELGFAQWDRILGECADEGALTLTLSGGEPLLHRDFRQIWMAAKRRGFVLELLTNAARIDAETADFLADWPATKISISLYGATEQTYRDLTGVAGIYAKVRQALEYLTERQLVFEVKSVFTRRNVHEFAAIRELAMRYAGAFRWDAELCGAYAEGGGDPLSERLSPGEIVNLERADTVRMNEWRQYVASLVPAAAPQTAFTCNIGRGGPHLDPYGGMRLCMLLENVTYDVLHGSVREGWREVLPARLAALAFPAGACASCAVASLCPACPAYALLEGCAPEGPVPFFCEVAHQRAQALQVSTQEETSRTFE